jgi:hypothetical protein
MHVISEAMKAVYKQRPQVVKRYLSVLPYDVVYTAQVNGAPLRDAKTNGIYAIPFDNGNGTLADVQPGHTVAVGTTAGASDVGLLRIRKAPIAGTFYVGETAPGEVPVADNYYLTVFDDFTRWSVKPRLVATKDGTEFEEYHDYDLAYDDQNRQREPIVNIVARVVDVATNQFVPLKHAGWVEPGQDYRIVELDCSLSQAVGNGLDADDWTPLWDVHDWVIVDGAVDEPYIKVQMPVGADWVSCTVTDGNAVSKTGRRHLWTHDRDSFPPLAAFKVLKDSRRQWREMQLEFFGTEDTSRTAIPYSCLVCYWEVATFGGDPAPDGYIDQFVSWVTEDEVTLVKGKSRHRLNIAGSGWWADHLAGYMTTLSDHSGQDHWWEFHNPTVDLVAHYVLRETTTFMTLCNLFLSGDDTPVGGEDVNDGSIFRQQNDLISGARAVWGTDSGGGMWLRPYYSYLEWTSAYLGYEERSARPSIASIGPSETRQGEVTITRRHYKPAGWVSADGSWYQDGKESKQLYSKAPGLTPGDGADRTSAPYQRVGGATEQVAQKRLNAYGGHWLARENRDMADFGWPLIDNLDAFEPCWNAPLLATWNHANPAGLTFTDAEFLVVGVEVQHSNEAGQPPKRVTPTLEQVTGGYPGDAYYPPEVKLPSWTFPPITTIWPGFYTTVIPILQFGGAPLLYDFGAQPGPVAAILSDGTVRRVEDFYDLAVTLDWADETNLPVSNVYAAARDPFSPCYRPPYTSNSVRAVILYGSFADEDSVSEPVLATLAGIGGSPSVINIWPLTGIDALTHAKILYHPGVKGLIVVSGKADPTSGQVRDAVYVSETGGLSWTEYLFVDPDISAFGYHTPTGPGVFLRRLDGGRIEVAAVAASIAGDVTSIYVRPYVTTDGASSFSPRAEAAIPYLSGPRIGYQADLATVWCPLTNDSNDDLALVVRNDDDGFARLLRSYRDTARADLDDITPTADSKDVLPDLRYGNSLAFAAGSRERALFAGYSLSGGDTVYGAFGTDKLTRMDAGDWRLIVQDADLTGVILDRDGAAAYLFGANGTVLFQPSFPLGTVYDRSIPGTTARVLELVALRAIEPTEYTYAVDFTEEPGEWEATDWNGCTAVRTSNGWEPCDGTGSLNPVRILLAVPGGFDPELTILKVSVSFQATAPGLTGTALTIVPQSVGADPWIIEHPGTTQVINFEYEGPWLGFNGYVLQGFDVNLLAASITGPQPLPWP